jgi:hypothetical protein
MPPPRPPPITALSIAGRPLGRINIRFLGQILNYDVVADCAPVAGRLDRQNTDKGATSSVLTRYSRLDVHAKPRTEGRCPDGTGRVGEERRVGGDEAPKLLKHVFLAG